MTSPFIVRADRPMPTAPVITIASRHSAGSNLRLFTATAPATGVSPWSDAANAILAFPFWIEVPTTFYKGFWVNGSSVGSNSEVGIWDGEAGAKTGTAYGKIVTTGSVGNSGASAPQVADFTDTVLNPGVYYAGMACNATTTNRYFRWSIATIGIAEWKSVGCWKQAGITLGSLGSTATPATYTNIAFPLFGLITRSYFDV